MGEGVVNSNKGGRAMDVIETRIDKDSEEYKANYSAMETLVQGPQAGIEKGAGRTSPEGYRSPGCPGKLPVRKKLDLLLDRNTPFLEIAPLAARGMYDGKIHGAGSWPASGGGRP